MSFIHFAINKHTDTFSVRLVEIIHFLKAADACEYDGITWRFL